MWSPIASVMILWYSSLLLLSPPPPPPLTSVVAPVIVNLTASPSTGVPRGTPFNLTCEVVGGPTLNFTWTTPTGPRVGPVISVDNVTANDAGEYRCEVTSEAGTTNDSITIRGEGCKWEGKGDLVIHDLVIGLYTAKNYKL